MFQNGFSALDQSSWYKAGIWVKIVGVLIIAFFFIYFISWRLITLQYCSGFCHTLTWISRGFTCIPHPDPPSHLLLHPIPLWEKERVGCFERIASKHVYSHCFLKDTDNFSFTSKSLKQRSVFGTLGKLTWFSWAS